MSAFRITIVLIITAAIAALTGCASAPRTTTSTVPVHVETSTSAIPLIRSWLEARRALAHSMNVSGDITVDQNGESNSASFSMKSKRLAEQTNARIDSLSVSVYGPFGINVAKFLASPQEYQFYDILHGETMRGATDTHSLEELTRLRGVSLTAMSDIIYGLPADDLNSADSLQLYSNGNHHILVIQDPVRYTTSSLDLSGTLTSDSSIPNLSLVRYRRWNGIVDPTRNAPAPNVTVRFGEPALVNGMSIPQHIEATAGQNKLTMEYTHIDLNPADLVVRI